MNESSDREEGEILKANSPGRDQIQVGMGVTSIDGHFLGNVKEIRDDEFLLDRPLARDIWVPFTVILATEDFSSNTRAVRPDEVVLTVSRAHIDTQGWRHT